MQRSEGVLTSIVMFFLLFLLVLYLFSTFNNNRVVESEPDRGEGEVTGDDDVTAQCRTHLATLPNDLEPVALLPPEEQSTDMADFIASLWPVARSPERAIRSALVAIEDRNQTSYTARFEDTTHFVEELSAGKSGEFYNFRLSTIDHVNGHLQFPNFGQTEFPRPAVL